MILQEHTFENRLYPAIFAILFLFASTFLYAQDNRGPKDRVELEAFIDGVMTSQLESRHIAGAVVSIVKDGELLMAKGYGYANVEERKPVVAEKTLFRPGSTSKLFTWTAVMQLVEQGKLDLEADINAYLKDFLIPETFPEPIAVKHLLTHTTGWEDIGRIFARTPEDIVPLGEYLANNMPARILPPGQITAYSNYGTAMAGYLVEVVSGMPFEQYIEENLYKPLGMEHSTFRQPLPPELEADMSEGYSYRNGVFKAEGFELVNGLAPAGSMSATATDMAKFMIAHLQHGRYQENRILKEETAKLMHSQLFTHDARIGGNAHGFWEDHLNNLRLIHHGGDTRMFHTMLILIPEFNTGLFVSYNSTTGGGPSRDELVQAFLDRYFPVPEAPTPEPPADFKERASRFAGSYGVTRTISTTYEKLMSLSFSIKVIPTQDGTLLTPLPDAIGGGKQWVEVEPLVFREIGGQTKMVFREDEHGQITHAFISQMPYFALVKLAWYQTPAFHFTLFGISAFFFLTTLAWPIRALIDRLRKRKKERQPGTRLARWIVGGMSGIFLLFLICLVVVVSNSEQLMYEVPSLLKTSLILPILATLLCFGAVVWSYFVWNKKYWSAWGRVHYSLVTLCGVAFILQLNHWNLLGFHY